jgi:hypothetical protein
MDPCLLLRQDATTSQALHSKRCMMIPALFVLFNVLFETFMMYTCNLSSEDEVSIQCFMNCLYLHYQMLSLHSKYMLVSRDQNAGQDWDIKIGNRSFENVTVRVSRKDSNKSKFDSGAN